MRIGITGHRHRAGISWDWVHDAFAAGLRARDPEWGVTSLASGADRLFAELVLERGGAIEFVCPMADYREDFEGEERAAFDRLRAAARSTIEIPPMPDRDSGYLAAGEWVARNCDLLFALWDGEPAAGKGGTAEIVAFARRLGRPVLHFEPLGRTIAPI